MADIDAMHEEVRRVREETDADRDVRLSLQSIEESLSGMASGEADPQPDRLKEIRAEIDRLADDVEGEVETGLNALAEQVREYEREQL